MRVGGRVRSGGEDEVDKYALQRAMGGVCDYGVRVVDEYARRANTGRRGWVAGEGECGGGGGWRRVVASGR